MPMRNFKPAVLYFALVLGTGFALGTIRVPFLVPRPGERYAELLEMPFMFVAIVLAARYVVRRIEAAGIRSRKRDHRGERHSSLRDDEGGRSRTPGHCHRACRPAIPGRPKIAGSTHNSS